MTVCEVLQLGNHALRERSTLIDDFSILPRLQDDLRDTLAHWRQMTGYGRGIAAPQIGVLKQVVLINIDRPWLLVNPAITWMSSEKIVVWDACLSYLSIFFQVQRAEKIRVSYTKEEGKKAEITVNGDLSELLQHEIDHLDGVLAIDRVLDLRTICTREEYEKRYGPRRTSSQRLT